MAMNSVFDIVEKKDSDRKLAEVANIPKKYVLFAEEVNLIVNAIKNIIEQGNLVNSLDEVLKAGGNSTRDASVGNFNAKEIQVGQNFSPESSGGIFRIQKNTDETISIIFDSISQNDSDNFGRLTASISNDGGFEFRHLENDDSHGIIAKIRKDGILLTLINSFLKVEKDGIVRDILISGIAQIADILGLQETLDYKADLVEGRVPKSQMQSSSLTLDPENFILKYINSRGENYEIDLPIELMFVDLDYDQETRKLKVKLFNGNVVEISLEDLVDLPEIQIATSNPSVSPSEGKKVYFNLMTGKVYLNVGSEWVFFGNTITDSEKQYLYNSKQHYESIGSNPHGTKLVQLKDWDNTLRSSIPADSSIIFKNSEGLFFPVSWEFARSLIPTPALNDFNIRRKGITIYDDFTNPANNGIINDFMRGSFNSGSLGVNILGDIDHPGNIQVASTNASTNGGGYILLSNTVTSRAMVITPGIQFDVIIFSNAFSNNVFYRFGFTNGSVNPQDISDGFYFEWNDANLIGKTASGSVRSSTSIYTMTTATWYHLRCKMVTSTNVVFEVYTMNGNLVWSSSLTTNIPAVGSVTNAGFIGFNQIAENKTMCVIDYIAVTFPPMNRGALN